MLCEMLFEKPSSSSLSKYIDIYKTEESKNGSILRFFVIIVNGTKGLKNIFLKQSLLFLTFCFTLLHYFIRIFLKNTNCI